MTECLGPTASNTVEQCCVSVILPVFNEAQFIEATLASLLNQSTPGFDLEILAIDGCSSDGTASTLVRIAQTDQRLRLLHNPLRNTAVSFNIGLHEARGQYVAILGAHCLYPPNYISVCLQQRALSDAVGCSGRAITVPANNSMQARLVAWTLGNTFASSGRSSRTRSAGFSDLLPYPVVRKQVLLDAGGFDEELARNQDYDMYRRLGARGYKLFLTEKTHCFYYARRSVKALLKYAFNSGLWHPKSLRKNVGSVAFRHFVPFIFVMTLIALIGACLFGFILQVPYTKVALAALSTIIGIHLGLGLLAGAEVSARERDFLAVFLAPVILAFHIAYGFGTLIGFLFDPYKLASRRAST